MPHTAVKLLLACISLHVCPLVTSAVNLQVTEDISTTGNSLLKASGKAGTLPISATRSALLRFDAAAALPGVLADAVTEARLTVYLPAVQTPGDLAIFLVTQEWAEDFTPKKSPTPTLAEIAVATIPAGDVVGKQFVTVNVTGVVKEWLRNPTADFGLAIRAVNGAQVTLGAKEGSGSGYPATLEVATGLSGVTSVDGDLLAAGSVGSAQLDSGLTLGGTTTGIFSGNGAGLTGISAANLTGEITKGQLANGSVDASKLAAGVTFRSILATGALQAQANTSYLAADPAMTAFTLPAAPAVGDLVTVTGVGGAGSKWNISAPGGQILKAPFGLVPKSIATSWHAVAGSASGEQLVAIENKGGGRVFTSRDFGQTWVETTPRLGGSTPIRYAPWNCLWLSSDGQRIYVASGSTYGLFTSGNFGAVWVTRNGLVAGSLIRNVNGLAASTDGTKIVITTSDNQVYTSTNGGTLFTARDTARQWRAVASSADGVRLAAVVENGPIMTSSDSGITWAAKASIQNWTAITCDPTGLKLVAAAYGDHLYTSVDGGETWTARDSKRDWKAVTMQADGVKMTATVQNGLIYNSRDSGATWQPLPRTTGNWVGVARAAQPATGEGTIVAVEGGKQINLLQPSTITGEEGETVRLQYLGRRDTDTGLVSVPTWGVLKQVEF